MAECFIGILFHRSNTHFSTKAKNMARQKRSDPNALNKRFARGGEWKGHVRSICQKARKKLQVRPVTVLTRDNYLKYSAPPDISDEPWCALPKSKAKATVTTWSNRLMGRVCVELVPCCSCDDARCSATLSWDFDTRDL